MKTLIRILCVFIITTGGFLTACSSRNSSGAGGSLQVKDAWARPAPVGGTSAVYFVIENSGNSDTLLSASSSAAENTELHMSKMEGDTMLMQPQENVPLPANEQVEFTPGGLHVMLIHLNVGLQPGDRLPVTLNFENAGNIQVEATVREP